MSAPRRRSLRLLQTTAGRLVLTAAVLSGLLAESGGAADWDEVRSRVLSQYNFRLHWTNVTGPPIHVGGVPIAKGVPLSIVTLAPGESTLLLVSADSFVRAYRADGLLAPEDLEFWVSNGSGLQVRHVAFESSDGRSLITLPDHSETALVRIARPQNCRTPLTVALFESYYEPAGDPVSYSTLACTASRTVALQPEGGSPEQGFCLIAPQQPVSVCVSGPARLKLETLLRYPPLESEVHQGYQLRLFADGTLLNIVDFETSVETNRQVFVGQAPETLGRRRSGYVEVPAGRHELRIDATASAWLRVLEQDRPEWLLARNQPPLSSQTARAIGFLFDHRVSHWNLSPADIEDAMADPASADGKAWVALRSARDNSRPQGPLRGYLTLRALAALRPDDPELSDLADQLRARYTFHRDLLPVRTGPDARQHTGYFCSRRLRSTQQTARDVIIAEQHIDDLAGRLPSARFTVTPNRPELASVYRLPPEVGPTLLQVVVNQQSVRGAVPLFVQFDGRPPVALLALAGPELTPDHYSAGAVEAGLSALGRRHTIAAPGTLGGPFARLDAPAPLVSAGTAELPVPAGVSEIRVWSPTAQPGSTAVALRYLDSKKFRLTEMEYTELSRRAGIASQGRNMFVAAVRRQSFVSPDQYAERELRNHWEPLLTWLRQEDESFRRGIIPAEGSAGSQLARSGTPVQPVRLTTEALSAARAYAQQEQWLLALEAWSDALPFVSGTSRSEVLFGRITALRQLGEDHLHETGLRGLLLFDADEAVRQEAASRLTRLYRQTGDEDALLRLQVVRTLSQPSDANLADLAQSLADLGRTDQALMLALLLPRSEPVVGIILRTTLHARWWQHYDQAVAGLGNLQEQQFWRAWQALALGRDVEARNHLQQAGPRGLALLERLQSGTTIQSQLRDANPTVRAQAVFDWERWWATSNAPQVWWDAEESVADYESSALLLNPARGAHSQYYVGRRTRPVKLIVQGPVRLRIHGRPLHPSGSTEPVNDWMIVRTGGQLYPTPINNNRIAQDLTVTNLPGLQAGRRLTQDVELGPGRHEVLVSGESVPLAVRVERLAPERELAVLPPVERNTVQAALAGVYGASEYDAGATWNPLQVRITGAGNPATGARCPIHHQASLQNAPAPNLAALPPALAERVLLRLDTGPISAVRTASVAMRSDLSVVSSESSPLERFHLLSRKGTTVDDAGFSTEMREAILWQAGRGADIVSLPLNDLDPNAVRRRLAVYLRLYERDESRRDVWLARGESCFRAHAHLPDLRDIHTRLTAQSGWDAVAQIERSAGLRTVPVAGWEPEVPYLRVRKALLGPLAAHEQVITGDQQIVLRLDNKRLTRLTVNVRLAEPPYVPPSPLNFAWQIDDGKEQQRQLLPPQAQHTFAVDIAEGAHTVRVRCVDPWVNQFLRVRMTESRDGAEHPLQQDVERVWHVATGDEPVVVPIEGPALIRVDEHRDGATFNELRLLPDGLQRVELRPSAGRTEALYRVYRLRYDPRRRPAPLKNIEFPPEPAPAPWISDAQLASASFSEQPGDRFVPGTLTSLSDAPHPEVVRRAGYPAEPRLLTVSEGGDFLMESIGAWSAGLGLFSRRPLLEGITGGKRADQFLQVSLDYHHRYDWYRTWNETEFLFRERRRGGETLGLWHTLRHDFPDSPWSLHLTGSGYLQHIDTSGPHNREWSLDGRVRILGDFDLGLNTSHNPQATLFGRVLSLNSNPFPSGVMDQDVFTGFKNDHREGLILADVLTHRPWLDTVWWVRPSLYTTENFNIFRPDHVGIAVGWGQWIRPFGLDLSYRIAEYYKNADRPHENTQQLLTLEGFSEGWAWGQLRCEASLYVQHRLDSGDTSLAGVLSFAWDAGFNDWHYRPGERDFQTLRRWRGAERRPLQPLDWW